MSDRYTYEAGFSQSDLDRNALLMQQQLKPFEHFAIYCVVFISLFIIVFSIAVAADHGHDAMSVFASLTRTLAMSSCVMAASLLIGFLLGFLFGIPMTLQRSNVVQAGQRSDGDPNNTNHGKQVPGRQFLNNTSFEEISDWLTKIIIGLTLVQFGSLITFLLSCANYAASMVTEVPLDITEISNKSTISPVDAAFFFSLIVSCLVGGCLFCYLETRTRLLLIFIGAGKLDDPNVETARAAETGVISGDELSAAPFVKVGATPNDDKVVRIPRSSLRTSLDLLGWASAQARKGNLQVAEDGLRDALQRDPENDEIRLRISEVRRLRGNHAGALDMLKEVIANANDLSRKIDLLKSAIYLSLYLDPPSSFQEAFQLIEEVLSLAGDKDPQVQVWRAAAAGQQYRWLLQHPNANPGDLPLARKEALAAARNKALESIRRVVDLVPDSQADPRVELKAMLSKPNVSMVGSTIIDDDLAVFKGDSEIENLINQ
jgi:tetratricopeptide (TPR) repeat protein